MKVLIKNKDISIHQNKVKYITVDWLVIYFINYLEISIVSLYEYDSSIFI